MHPLLSSTLILVGLGFAHTVHAQGFQTITNIPYITGSGQVTLQDFITAVYFLAITIAGLIAVVKIIFAGVKYMLSDVVTNKESAKKDIRGALLGLLIVIGAVFILTIINPDLTRTQLGEVRVIGGGSPQTPTAPPEYIDRGQYEVNDFQTVDLDHRYTPAGRRDLINDLTNSGALVGATNLDGGNLNNEFRQQTIQRCREAKDQGGEILLIEEFSETGEGDRWYICIKPPEEREIVIWSVPYSNSNPRYTIEEFEELIRNLQVAGDYIYHTPIEWSQREEEGRNCMINEYGEPHVTRVRDEGYYLICTPVERVGSHEVRVTPDIVLNTRDVYTFQQYGLLRTQMDNEGLILENTILDFINRDIVLSQCATQLEGEPVIIKHESQNGDQVIERLICLTQTMEQPSPISETGDVHLSTLEGDVFINTEHEYMVTEYHELDRALTRSGVVLDTFTIIPTDLQSIVGAQQACVQAGGEGVTVQRLYVFEQILYCIEPSAFVVE